MKIKSSLSVTELASLHIRIMELTAAGKIEPEHPHVLSATTRGIVIQALASSSGQLPSAELTFSSCSHKDGRLPEVQIWSSSASRRRTSSASRTGFSLDPVDHRPSFGDKIGFLRFPPRKAVAVALTDGEVAALFRLREEQERHSERAYGDRHGRPNGRRSIADIVDPPALRHLREMQEQIAAIANPPHLEALREADRRIKELIDPIQIKMLADAFAGVTARIDPELFGGGVAKHFLEEWRALEAPGDYFAGMKALMPAESLSATIAKSLAADAELFGSIGRTADLFKAVEIPDFAKELQALAGMSFETQKLLATLDVSRGFADLLNVNDVTRSLVEYETERLNRAYAGFSASIAHRPDWLASAPDFVRTTPGEIVFAQARFVRTVTAHEEIEEESADEIWADVQTHTLGYIEAVLPELNPKLMKSWKGAWDTARRRGPDWARQAASSMRFLLIETVEAVAPLDEVKKSGVPARYIKDGQILRLGQINWLCEPVQNRTYGKVVRADLDSAMTIIEAMNEAVHRDDYEEIEDAFHTMAVRAAVALCNLLKLWKIRT